MLVSIHQLMQKILQLNIVNYLLVYMKKRMSVNTQVSGKRITVKILLVHTKHNIKKHMLEYMKNNT